MKLTSLEDLERALELANRHNVAILELEGVRIVRPVDQYGFIQPAQEAPAAGDGKHVDPLDAVLSDPLFVRRGGA